MAFVKSRLDYVLMDLGFCLMKCHVCGLKDQCIDLGTNCLNCP